MRFSQLLFISLLLQTCQIRASDCEENFFTQKKCGQESSCATELMTYKLKPGNSGECELRYTEDKVDTLCSFKEDKLGEVFKITRSILEKKREMDKAETKRMLELSKQSISESQKMLKIAICGPENKREKVLEAEDKADGKHILQDKDIRKGVCVGIFNHDIKHSARWKFTDVPDKNVCAALLSNTCEALGIMYSDDFFNLECDSLYDLYWIQSYHEFSRADAETNPSHKTRIGSKTCLKKSMEEKVVKKCDQAALWAKEADKYKDSDLFVKAAELGYMPLIEGLIKKKHKIDMANKEGKTALRGAVTQCRGEVVKYLIDHKAKNYGKDQFGRTPLMEAVLCQDPLVTETVLHLKTDINAQDRYGETALMIAAESGNDKAVKILLGAGADRSIQTKKKATAITKAKRAGFTKIVQLLQ